MTMKSKIFAAGMSLVFIAGSIMPAQAFTPVVKSESAQSGSPMVVQVQGEDNSYRWRHDRRFDRRERFDRGERFDRRDRWDRRDRYGYYNGHRGYRDRRPGYREYNGYWFPLAAFGAGALLGGAVSAAPRDRVDQHSTWCLNRYRSYDVRSNTYQPTNGPRRACVSPY